MIVKDKAFQNLKSSELQQKGATVSGKTFTMLSEMAFCSFLLLGVYDFLLSCFFYQNPCQDFQFMLEEF